MEGDRWIAGLAALLTMVALLGLLTLTATRGVVGPAQRALPAPIVPSLCMTSQLICTAPPLPSGYPCSCADPLRGALPGTVVPAGEAARLSLYLRGRPELSGEDELLLGP